MEHGMLSLNDTHYFELELQLRGFKKEIIED